MNELKEVKGFDYSLIDPDIAEKLKKYDKQLTNIYNNYTLEVGEILYKAQQEFANPKDGIFLKWVEHKGFKRGNAYNYIDIYKAFQNLESKKQEIFIEQSKSLQIEMSKPSANTIANEAVFEGEITTHKAYKELERQLKQKDAELEQTKRSEEIAISKLEEMESKEPEVVEVTKEVVPENFQQLETSEKRLQAENRRLAQEAEALKKRLEKIENDSAEVERLERTIEQLNEQKEEVNRILDANEKLNQMENVFHAFFDTNMAPLKYKPLVNELHGFNGTERVKKLVDLARAWVDDMDRMLPSENRKMIEGEIIND